MNLERRKFLKNLFLIGIGLFLSKFVQFGLSEKKEIKIGDFVAKENGKEVIFFKNGQKVFTLNEKGELIIG